MKQHSQDFKTNISQLGRMLDSKITYTLNQKEITLGKSDLNRVSPNFESALLKSVMKGLEIDSNIDIPLKTILRYQLGVKVGGEYEYLNYGNFVVYKSEKEENTKSYKITCYDKMLYSMKPYENIGVTYPITIRNYINAICTFLGLTFKNINDTFANYDKIIQNELYLDSDGNTIGYSFRDVFDELSQVVGGNICINEEDDEVEIRYINETNDIIDEHFLKDIDVNVGEKFGPVNSIVLSRADGSDNVYLRDEESVTQNGLCEIKISDNQIMNFNDRADYLQDILNQLDGLEYYTNDFKSTGICYFNVCDKYNLKIRDNIYPCIMFNDEIIVTQGLEENVYTELPEETETEYQYASKDDRQRNQAYIIAKKNKAEIEALASKVVDLSNTISGVGSIRLENAHEGVLHRLEITGNISCLFPSDNLVPSDDLLPLEIILNVDDDDYILDIDYLQYNSVDEHDTFIYEDGKCWIERIDETIEDRESIFINVKTDSEISIDLFPNAMFKCTYLLENDYTSTFANQVTVSSELNILADTIEAKVSQVADEDGNVTSASLILAVNNDESQTTIEADKINLNGIVTANERFKILKDGSMEAINGRFNGSVLLQDNGILDEDEQKFVIEKDDSSLYMYSNGLYFTKKNGVYAETFRIDMTHNPYWPFMLTLEDPSRGKTTTIDPGYFATEDIYGENLYISGTKNRVINIDDKQLLMNAYETTTPYFGDIGSNKTDNNGYCKIEINNKFYKAIESDDYKVFIQECGEGNLYVKKHNNYFEVFGTKNLDFDWEIKAIQKDYKNVYMNELKERR